MVVPLWKMNITFRAENDFSEPGRLWNDGYACFLWK
jgi:hypothetical protein